MTTATPSRYSNTHHKTNHPQDWTITLTELLRLIQFYNSPGYTPCDTSEDGFCPAE